MPAWEDTGNGTFSLRRVQLPVLSAAVLYLAACAGTAGTTGDSVAPQSDPPRVEEASSHLFFTSTVLEFGDVQVGTTGSLELVMTNTGDAGTLITREAITGLAFTVSGIGAGMTLRPHQSVVLAVDFRPVAPGRSSGGVVISSTSPDAVTIITFAGTGVDRLPNTVTLNWEPSASAVGYHVYRAYQAGGPYRKLNRGLLRDTTYTDAEVESGGSYFYVVSAQGVGNQESRFSDEVSVTIPDPQAVSDPGLSGTDSAL